MPQETQNESDNGKVLDQSGDDSSKVKVGTTSYNNSWKICCKTRTTSNN